MIHQPIIDKLIAALLNINNQPAIIESTDAIIQVSTASDFAHNLFDNAMWYDIYDCIACDKTENSTVLSEYPDFFKGKYGAYHKTEPLTQIEFSVWAMALQRNDKADWLALLFK